MITFITDPYIIDPLGIAYLSAMLKKSGYQPKLVLTDDLDTTIIDTPIVAYSVTTGKHRHYAEINRWVKDKYPGITSIFGGPHCTFFPEFVKEKGINFIFRGEGFEPIVKFLDNWIKDKGLNTESLYTIPNLAYYEKDEIVINELAPPIKMVELPFPDRQLIYQFEKNFKNPIRNVMASFVCPMNCTYCFNKRYKKLGYNCRLRSIEHVIEECARLVKEYPTQLIYFQDDIFPVYRKDWLQSFCTKYATQVDMPFHIQVRIEMLSKDNITMLKSAGLHGVTFAVETADENVRSTLLNRHITNKTIIDGANLLRKHGIKFRIENMLGLPGETLQSALDTLMLNIQCRPDIGWASLFTPYPGTDLGEQCQAEGLVEDDFVEMDDFKEDFFTEATLKLKDKKQIERLQKLFGLVCMIPSLRPLLPLLMVLPLKYKNVYKQVKQFLYSKRLYKIE